MIAKSQTDEVIDTLRKYLTPTQFGELLGELTGTKAYHKNKSFRETINEILRRLGERASDHQ